MTVRPSAAARRSISWVTPVASEPTLTLGDVERGLEQVAAATLLPFVFVLNNSFRRTHEQYYSFFVQDDFRVNDNLTLILEAQNLTDERNTLFIDSVREDTLFETRIGRTYTLGATYKF